MIYIYDLEYSSKVAPLKLTLQDQDFLSNKLMNLNTLVFNGEVFEMLN